MICEKKPPRSREDAPLYTLLFMHLHGKSRGCASIVHSYPAMIRFGQMSNTIPTSMRTIPWKAEIRRKLCSSKKQIAFSWNIFLKSELHIHWPRLATPPPYRNGGAVIGVVGQARGILRNPYQNTDVPRPYPYYHNEVTPSTPK